MYLPTYLLKNTGKCLPTSCQLSVSERKFGLPNPKEVADALMLYIHALWGPETTGSTSRNLKLCEKGVL